MSAAVAFWSTELKLGAPMEVQPPLGYFLNIQQAAFEGDKGHLVVYAVTTSIDGEPIKPVLCTLRYGLIEQCSLSLVFGYDVPVTFLVTGDSKGSVHLSGYLEPGPEEDEEGDEEAAEEEHEEQPMHEAPAYRQQYAQPVPIKTSIGRQAAAEDDLEFQ